MGSHSRTKGARIEREAVRACQAHLASPEICSRTSQSDGKYSADIKDALPGFHVEVKGRSGIYALRWMGQAKRDCEAQKSSGGEDKKPIVLLREDGDPDFYLMVKLAHVQDLCKAVEANEWAKKGDDGNE